MKNRYILGLVKSRSQWRARVRFYKSDEFLKKIKLANKKLWRKEEINNKNRAYKLQLMADITRAEEACGDLLAGMGLQFYFQKAFFSPFHRICDFFIPKHNLVIEVDGPSHLNTRGKDKKKDSTAAFRGYRTLRFKNREVLKEPWFVQEQIGKICDLSVLKKRRRYIKHEAQKRQEKYQKRVYNFTMRGVEANKEERERNKRRASAKPPVDYMKLAILYGITEEEARKALSTPTLDTIR